MGNTCFFLGVMGALLTPNLLLMAQSDTAVRAVNSVLIEAEKPVETAQQAVTLEARAMDEARGKSLAESLESLPGVTVLRTGQNIAKPAIHGLYGSRVLILNNGVRHEGQQWGSEHAPEIDPFSAGRIRVVKGAESVRYGTDAIAGVILVEPAPLPTVAVDTPSARAGIGGEVHLDAFSNGRRGVAALMLQGAVPHIKGVSWRVQGVGQAGGNIHAPDYALGNSGMRETNYAASLQWLRVKSTWRAYYSRFGSVVGVFKGAHLGNTTDLTEALTRAQPLPQYTPTAFTYRIGRPLQVIRHDLAKLEYLRPLGGAGKHGTLQAVYAFQFNHRDEFDAHRPRGATDTTRADLRFRLATHTVDIAWKQPLRGRWTGQIGTGFLAQHNTQSGRQQLIPTFDAVQGGIFATEKYLGDDFQVEAGLRVDKKWLTTYQYEYRQTVVRRFQFGSFSALLGANKRFSPAFSAALAVSSAWRPPNINELFSNGLHHGSARYELGNANLRPEKALNTALTLNCTRPRVQAEVQLFANYLHGYIYAQPEAQPVLTIRGAFIAFRYAQTNALFAGADASFAYQPTKRLALTLRPSYLYVRDVSSRNWLVGIAPSRVAAEATYSPVVRGLRGPYITLGGVYVGHQGHVPAGTAERPADYLPPPPAYALMNVRTGFSIPLPPHTAASLSCSLECTNLLNTRYRDYLNAFRYFADEQGRSVNVRIKYVF